MYSEAIDRFFKDNTQQMLSDIAALVAVDSTRQTPKPTMPFGEGPALALKEALDMGSRMGFVTRNIDNYAGVIETPGEPKLAILAHLDVVEAGEGWDTDPFTMVRRGDTIYGRGVSDDKGPAIAALYAMAAVKSVKPDLQGVRLVLGCAEETGSECMAYYMNREALPSMVFSPDAEFPVINIEKGGCAPEFGDTWPEDSSAVGLVSFSGGKTTNILPGKARAEVRGLDVDTVSKAASAMTTGTEYTVSSTADGVKIVCEGRGAHASTPDEGVNAQTALIKLLNTLGLQGRPGEALKKLEALFPHGDNCGEALGIKMSDDISGSLTLAFSVLNMDSRGFSACFDSRVPICGNEENVALRVQKVLEDVGFRLASKVDMRPPHHTPADSLFVQTLLKAYESRSGRKGECIAIGGGTYVHEVEGGVAFGCTMPGTETNIHGANESAPVEELVTSGKIFADVICELC